VPVVAAAAGTILLTAADVQPLMPPKVVIRVFGSSAAPTMGKAWQVLIVALLVAISAAAVLWGWRQIRRPAVLLVCLICAAALVANVIVLYPAVSVADLMARRANWALYGLIFIMPFLACVGTVLLALAADRRFASGVLLATGAAGYVFYFQQLDFYLNLRFPHDPAPGRATFAGMIGAGIVLIAGLTARWDDAPDAARVARLATRPAIVAARLIAAGAAIAVNVAVFYLFAAFLAQAESGSLFASSLVVYGVAPGALAVAALVAMARLPVSDRRLAAGALITSGFLGLAYFVNSRVFGWLVPLHSVPGQELLGDDIGAGGCFAFMLAGFTALAGRRATPSGTAGAEPAAEIDGENPAARSETTRYLCAAAHLDSGFARQAIHQLMGSAYETLVPSHGVDTGTVLRHCFAARRRQIVRDVLVTVIVLGIVALALGLRSLIGLRDAAILGFLAAVVAFTERWVSRYRVAARQLSRDTFDPAHAPWLTTGELEQLGQALASERGNVNVYGTYHPFVGSGSAQGGWSFAVNLEKGKELPGSSARRTPKPFEIEELYHASQLAIEALGLTDLVVENRLLVDGHSIRDDRRFIPHRKERPATIIDTEILDKLVRAPELCNRPYQCVRLPDWRGDLVLSVFINFTRRGSGLLVEVQHYVLAPVKDLYREVDKLASRSSLRRWVTELRAAPATMTGALIAAPFSTLGSIWRAGTRWVVEHSIRRRIEDDPGYNYGAMTSIRELAQSKRYRKYFQQLDRSLNANLMDRQVLDTIMTFLDARDIDISQFEEQRTTILNQGILMSGGKLSAGSIAIGERSRATQVLENIPTIRRAG